MACSPETAAASALTGVITDPRTLEMAYPRFVEPEVIRINAAMLMPPGPDYAASQLEKGPNIQPLPQFDSLPEVLEGPVLLKVGDNISTDEIMPAGAKVLPYRSNIPKISKFVFAQVDESYSDRALKHQKQGSFVVGGYNYGQGSSREHAALAPRYLGIKTVIAKSFARIHWQNLVNFGILPLTFVRPNDWEMIKQEDVLTITDLGRAIQKGKRISVCNLTRNETYETEHSMSDRQIEIVLKGSLVNVVRDRQKNFSPSQP